MGFTRSQGRSRSKCPGGSILINCLFCKIARREVDAVVIHDDEDVMAFLDIGPIRDGHLQIIPKAHFDTFELLPSELAAKILDLTTLHG